MNIACISHYSPLNNNKSNRWIADFYSSINNIDKVNTVYFINISYGSNMERIHIQQKKIDEKNIDLTILVPKYFKVFRKHAIFDRYYIYKLNSILMNYLKKNEIKINVVHINTLYYSFFSTIFKEDSSILFLHVHENKSLLRSILRRNKYSALKFINKFNYIIRQTPIDINRLEEENRNIIYLPNAFDNSYFKYSLKNKKNNLSIVSIGFLRKTKNYYLALDVIKFLNLKGYSIEYKIIGSGPELNNLLSYTKKLGIENSVKFLGYQDKETIQRTLESSSLLLNTSPFESFGNVFLEALSTGTPIVTCANGGPEYLFKWSENKFYIGEFTKATIEEIGEGIIKVWDNPFSEWENISKSIKQRFSSEKFLLDLIKIVEKGDDDFQGWWKEK